MLAGNLLRYFGQVLVVISVTELGMRLLHRNSPRVRLAGWRLTLAICVLLPFMPLREITITAPHTSTLVLPVNVNTTGAMAASLARLWMSQLSIWLTIAIAALPWLLLTGVVARATWLGLGFTRLSRLRAQSVPLNAAAITADLDALKQTLAPHADLRWHDAAMQPVTFGLHHPVILLPRRFTALPGDAQRAVLCHELLHVARRDWAWTLAEEALQTALWWHPAIWWALAQVHLHREETIDADVVAITGARQSYMRALIAFADATAAGSIARATPVVPFIRRRHLAARLQQLVQEVPMSRVRLMSATAALAVLVAGASWASIAAMPLQKSTPAAPDAATAATSDQSSPSDEKPYKSDEVDRKPKLINEVKGQYPPDAMKAKVQGEVEVMATITVEGTVSKTEVVKSIPMLDKAATDAIKQFKFEPGMLDGKAVPVICHVTMRFALK